jgi:hypothetical protein
MRYEDGEIRDVAGALKSFKLDVARLRDEFDDELTSAGRSNVPVWFRGLSDADWQLLTTMALHGDMNQEQAMMNRFMQNATQFLDHRPDDWEWMFLMRHHGLPSRLLDWTESALIGLYFAVTPILTSGARVEELQRHDDSDSALWCLLPAELNKESALYTRRPLEIPMLEDEDSNSGHYLPKQVALAPEKSVANPCAGLAMRSIARMQAQKGVFVVTHRSQTPIEEVGDGTHVWRYVIRARRKAIIRNELRVLGVTPLTVFPELDSVAFDARGGLGV